MDKEFDMDGVILTLAGIAVGTILIFAIVTMIKKALQPALHKPSTESGDMIRQQQQRTRDIQRDQDQMMRNMKQRIQSGRH